MGEMEKPRRYRRRHLILLLAFDAGGRHVAKEGGEGTFELVGPEGGSKGMAFHRAIVCSDIGMKLIWMWVTPSQNMSERTTHNSVSCSVEFRECYPKPIMAYYDQGDSSVFYIL